MKDLDYLLYGIVALGLGGYFLVVEIQAIVKKDWDELTWLGKTAHIKIVGGSIMALMLGITLTIRYFTFGH